MSIAIKAMQQKIRNTVIVFDWDDTLFPSTYLAKILLRPNQQSNSNKFKIKFHHDAAQELKSKITPKETEEFKQLSIITYHLLIDYMATHSHICIISAGGPEWVKRQLSMVKHIGCYKFILNLICPETQFSMFRNNRNNTKGIKIYGMSNSLIKLLAKKQVDDDIGRYQVLLWESKVLKEIFNERTKFTGDRIINTFVIIGDASYDYVAAEMLRGNINNKFNTRNDIFVDRIKLKINPTIDVLMDEQKVLCLFGQERCFQKHSMDGIKNFDWSYTEAIKNKGSEYFTGPWEY